MLNTSLRFTWREGMPRWTMAGTSHAPSADDGQHSQMEAIFQVHLATLGCVQCVIGFALHGLSLDDSCMTPQDAIHGARSCASCISIAYMRSWV